MTISPQTHRSSQTDPKSGLLQYFLYNTPYRRNPRQLEQIWLLVILVTNDQKQQEVMNRQIKDINHFT